MAIPPDTDTMTPEDVQDGPDVLLWTALVTAPPEGATVPDLMTATGMSRPWIYLRLRDLADADYPYPDKADVPAALEFAAAALQARIRGRLTDLCALKGGLVCCFERGDEASEQFGEDGPLWIGPAVQGAGELGLPVAVHGVEVAGAVGGELE